MKKLLPLLLLFTLNAFAQDTWPDVFTVSPDSLHYNELKTSYWQYQLTGNDSVPFNKITTPAYVKQFKKLSDQNIRRYRDETHAWVRYHINNPHNYPVTITFPQHVKWATLYIGLNGKWKHFTSGFAVPWSKRDGIKQSRQVVYIMPPGATVQVYAFLSKIDNPADLFPQVNNYYSEVKENYHDQLHFTQDDIVSACFFGFILFAVIFNLLFFYVNRQRMYLVYSLALLFSALYSVSDIVPKSLFKENYRASSIFEVVSIIGMMFMVLHTLRLFFRLKEHYPRWDRFFVWVPPILMVVGLSHFAFSGVLAKGILITAAVLAVFFCLISIIGIIVIIILFLRKKNTEARFFVLAALPFFLSLPIVMLLDMVWVIYISSTWTILVLSWGMFARFKGLQIENARVALEKEEERNRLIAQQNELLEEQVAERTAELQQSLAELQQTQNQLIQSEKMASLGELTAGIAHEIQNPLNFVNNFSDVSIELLDEMGEEMDKGDTEEAKAIAQDIKLNLEKIAHHGRRADSIVKGMLQHSRSSSGQKEPIDMSVLADEYLRLAYHGLRAKDKSFNADLVTHYAEGLPKAKVLPQDVGRVLLNLLTNAFYATQEKGKQMAGSGYKPVVEVSTRQKGNAIEVTVKDNGIGIPEAIKDKILQPFFTTKPTGEGTGLGLSLSYDIIVKAHGGTIDIESTEGQGSEFKITLPV